MSSEHPSPYSPEISSQHDGVSSATFEELVRAHHRDLLVYAHALTQNAATARDILQDAFVIAYQKRGVFDETRDFASWMRGIIRNKWREWLRKNRNYDLGDHELARMDEDLAAWQAKRACGEAALFESLEDCMRNLPPLLQEAVQAYYYEGRSGDEAAAHLHTAPTTMRKRLQRARTLLKQCLETKKAARTASHPS